MDNRDTSGLSLLGNQNTHYSYDYNPKVLETFENKHQDKDYFIKFNCPEFTSLCPKTGQPDFATIYISYIADKLCVESKALKLYLFSFRNHGDFHEDVVNKIAKDLINLLDPRYLEVWGKFTPRGGLSIDPYTNYGKKNTENPQANIQTTMVFAGQAKKEANGIKSWEEFAFQRLLQHDLYPETITNR